MAVPEEELVRLIIDLKESLERELNGVESSIRQELREGFAVVNTRFDTQAARLDRRAALETKDKLEGSTGH